MKGIHFEAVDGYVVEEYTELDFENIVLESVPAPYCTACGTSLAESPAGIHQCQACGSFNFVELEV